jgi:hypothetical protein
VQDTELMMAGAVLTVLPVTDYIHYFIVLFPVPFLGIAHALEQYANNRLIRQSVILFFRVFVQSASGPMILAVGTALGVGPQLVGIVVRITRRFAST